MTIATFGFGRKSLAPLAVASISAAVLTLVVARSHGLARLLLLALSGAIVAAALAFCAAVLVKIHKLLLGLSESTVDRLFTQLDSLLGVYTTLQPVLPLPPMRGWAISPDFATLLIRTIYQQRPSTVLELGSGVSTLITAYCLRNTGQGKLISLEHQADHAARINTEIHMHGLSRYATVIHAPLVQQVCPGSVQSWEFYDLTSLADIREVDLLTVDGPPADVNPLRRYPALPLLHPRLTSGAIILIDDAARPGEQEIIRRWLQAFRDLHYTAISCEKGAALLRKQ